MMLEFLRVVIEVVKRIENMFKVLYHMEVLVMLGLAISLLLNNHKVLYGKRVLAHRYARTLVLAVYNRKSSSAGKIVDC